MYSMIFWCPEDTYKINVSPEYILCFSLTFNSCFMCNKCYIIFDDSSKSHSKVFRSVSKETCFLTPISVGFTYFSCIAHGQWEDRSRHWLGIRTVALHPPRTLRIKMHAEREEAMVFQLPRTIVWAYGKVKYCDLKGFPVEGKVKLFSSRQLRKLTRPRKLIKLQDNKTPPPCT